MVLFLSIDVLRDKKRPANVMPAGLNILWQKTKKMIECTPG